MIVLRTYELLAVLVWAAATLASAAASGAMTAADRQWREKIATMIAQAEGMAAVAQAADRYDAAGVPHLRSSQTTAAEANVEPDAFVPSIRYYWPEGNENCEGSAIKATFFPTSCILHDGISTRWNCVPHNSTDERFGYMENYVYMNDDCSGPPTFVIPSPAFVTDECVDNTIVHCSEEVKYGLEDAFVVAHYTNATCANETLLYAEFEPNGCNGYNYSAVCEGDVLTRAVYSDENCIGEPVVGPEYFDVGVCLVHEYDDDEYDDDDIEEDDEVEDDDDSFQTTMCSIDEFFSLYPVGPYQTDDDGYDDDDGAIAVRAATPWIVALSSMILFVCAVLA